MANIIELVTSSVAKLVLGVVLGIVALVVISRLLKVILVLIALLLVGVAIYHLSRALRHGEEDESLLQRWARLGERRDRRR